MYSSKFHFWNDMDGYSQELVGEESPDTRSISRLLGFFHMLDKSVLIYSTHLHGKSVRKNCRSTRGVRSRSCVVGQFVCSVWQADVMRQFLHLADPQILIGSFGFCGRLLCLPSSWFSKTFWRGNTVLAKKRNCLLGGKATPVSG